MASDLNDGQFWLPSQFLTDDDILMDYNCGNKISNNKGDKFSRESDFPHEYSFGFGSLSPYSNLSSPVESVVGSTETESDEEDYMAGLTRKMAHSTLQDNFWKVETGLGYESQKSLTMSGSPQSTLCPLLGGCGCKPGSSHGSPNCPSRISSPPPLPSAGLAMGRNVAGWDLLYAAAGEVARMRMIDEGSGYNHRNRGPLGLSQKPSPVSVPLANLNQKPNAGYHCNQSAAFQQLQVAHFQQLKQQQMMKQQGSAVWGQSTGTVQYPQQQTVPNRAKSCGVRTPGLSHSAWPSLQQSQQQQPHTGSGMRALFLGSPGSKGKSERSRGCEGDLRGELERLWELREMSSERVPVEVCKGVNGLEKVVLREARGSSAEVYLYGCHVTSWKNEHGEELLFVSSKAIFKPPKAIRGGIPICFPQFSSHGALEQHGFARNRFWIVDPDPSPFPTNSASKAFVDLILKPSEEDMKIWPHSFEFRLRVALGPGGDLMLTSRIRNTSSEGKPFTFTFAYHTYFSVSDISEVRVEGLETLDYLDNLQNKERFTEQGDAITFESEVDKIYLSTPTKIAILDHEKKRTFVIRKDGLPDAVVWNPWDKKAKAMADFGDDEYKHMLCVEAAAVEKPITLKPGEEWRGRQELSAVPSSYCSGQLDPLRVLQSS